LRETSLIQVRARIMDPFGIDSDRNCSIIPKVFIVFSKENGIIPIGIHSEKFYNTCPEQIVRMFIFTLDVNLISKRHMHVQSSSFKRDALVGTLLSRRIFCTHFFPRSSHEKHFVTHLGPIGAIDCDTAEHFSAMKHGSYADDELRIL